MKSSKTKKAVNFIFICFLAYQLIQHSMMYLYHDDYGYVSLKYGFDVGTVGMNYGMGDILSYLKLHYMEWGGRVLYYFLFIFIFRYGGLWGLRIVQAFLVSLIFYEIYSIIRGNNKDSILLAFTTVAMWGMLQITVLRESVYWFAASSGYVWPFAALLTGILVQRDIWVIKNQRRKNALCVMLFCLAAFSQEQVALLTISYCGMVVLQEIKKIQITNLFCLMGALIGGAIEILAPGNFVRAAGNENVEFVSMTLFEKIVHNVPLIINLSFGSHAMLYVVALLIAVFLGSVVLCKRGKTGKWIYLFGIAGVGYPIMYLIRIRYGVFGMGLYYMTVVWTILMAVWMVIYCINSRNRFLTSLLIGVAASQGMLAVLPALNYRTAIITQILTIIMILSIWKEFVEAVTWNQKKMCGMGVIYVIVAGCFAMNAMQIGVGYYYNNRLNQANHKNLSGAGAALKAGEEVSELTLYKMQDDRYAGDMPYRKEYISPWLKEYYELPQTVEFVYEDAWKYGGE